VPLLREPMRLKDRHALTRRMRQRRPRATVRSIARGSGGVVSATFVHDLACGQRAVCSRAVAEAIAEQLGAGLEELFEPAPQTGGGALAG
jgi:hypothetical protein